MKPLVIVRRYEYEEPYHTQLEFEITNGQFSGRTDLYCGVQEIKAIGEGLARFPSCIDDEFRYVHGSENPEDRCYRFFLLRAYITDLAGHCALQFKVNNNTNEPLEGMCAFSIPADAAAINRLGVMLTKFAELKHLELHWSLGEEELFEFHQNDNA